MVVLVPLAIWRGRSPTLPGLEQLSPAQQSKVEAALREGAAELPASVAQMSTRSETLMGGTPAGTGFSLMEPLRTATLSDRPVFRWNPLPGADGYTVVVMDENLKGIAGPVAVSGTTWIPPEPLPRDRSYVWQVTARRGEESVTAPAPPAPPARFRVMDPGTAEILERVLRAAPDSHLLLGLLYTEAGARQEAEAHLRQVPETDPYAPVASRTLERLADRTAIR
jgi:hypothetical protein